MPALSFSIGSKLKSLVSPIPTGKNIIKYVALHWYLQNKSNVLFLQRRPPGFQFYLQKFSAADKLRPTLFNLADCYHSVEAGFGVAGRSITVRTLQQDIYFLDATSLASTIIR